MRLPRLLLLNLLVFVFTSSFVTKPNRPDISACDIKVTYKVKHTAPGLNNGEIEVSVSKGTAPYQIHWIGLGEKFVEGSKISRLKEGFYTVHVVDANQCVKIVQNIKVEAK